MFRRALAVYLYIAAIAAALLLLLPSGPPPTVANPEPPPPPAPTAQGLCDDVWAVPGFTTRFMVYDKVVHNQLRMGPEVEGRVRTEVQNELRKVLCTDNAALYDLSNYDRNGFDAALVKSGRKASIATISGMTLEDRNLVVQQLMDTVAFGQPNLEAASKAYASWYHRAANSPTDIPGLGVIDVAPQRSTFLVYQAENGMRYLRLECGFQPTKLL